MSAQCFDFTRATCTPCEVGADFYKQLTWQKEDPLNPGQYLPVDITGYIVKMQVRENVEATTVVLEISTANTYVALDGPHGVITLHVPAAITSTLVAGVYRYDMDLTDTSGFVTRFIQGFFEISGAITR